VDLTDHNANRYPIVHGPAIDVTVLADSPSGSIWWLQDLPTTVARQVRPYGVLKFVSWLKAVALMVEISVLIAASG